MKSLGQQNGLFSGKGLFVPLIRSISFRWFTASELISVQSRYHRSFRKFRFFPRCLRYVLKTQTNLFRIIIKTWVIPVIRFCVCMILTAKNGNPVTALPKPYCLGALIG